MYAHEGPGSTPAGGRIRWILAVLTFVALSVAFFAGTVHQTDAIADRHEAVTASVSVTDGGQVSPSPDTAATLSDPSGGWLSAIVGACALFALWMLLAGLTFAVGRARSSLPTPSRALSARPCVSAPTVTVTRSLLLDLSISRT